MGGGGSRLDLQLRTRCRGGEGIHVYAASIKCLLYVRHWAYSHLTLSGLNEANIIIPIS